MRCNYYFSCFAVICLSVSAASGRAQELSTPDSTSLPSQQQIPSVLDQAPAAPVIRYSGGMLTIEATNSSLRTILDSLAKQTGTVVQGLSHDERVFGIYGPGNPQEVLASLLDDSGYNVLISGKSADGAPREIVLTARAGSGGSVGRGQSGSTQAADENDEDTADGGQVQPPPQPALFAPQQQGQPSAPSPQQVKTPQQLLEELQRLRLGPAANGAPQP